jgi:hypothetical protein
MALAHYDTHRSRPGTPTRLAGSRHHGQVDLAEVVPTRPESFSRGSAGMRYKIAQVFASLRVQAVPGGTPPRPPAPPAPFIRLSTHGAAPDDAT